MKRLDPGILKRSVFAYIVGSMFVLVTIVMFYAYFIQNHIHQESDDFFHGYVLFAIFASMVGIFSVLAWLIYHRIRAHHDAINELYSEQIKQINESNQLLIESQNILQNIFDTTPNIMITTDGFGLQRANVAMLDFFGYKSIEEFKEKHEGVCDFFVHEKSSVFSAMKGNEWLKYILFHPYETHKVSMSKGKKKHYFMVNANRLYKNSASTDALVVFSDITAIEEIQERYEYAINGTQDGIWDWNLETGEIYFSPRWKQMLGYEDTELENALFTWQSRVHPDDLHKAEEEFMANIEGKTDYYENIHRLKHKDGHWVWILDRGKTIFDENSKAVRMVGFHTDITQTKKLEQELLDKEDIMIAQSRNAAMGEMISMIAHQWRQPISVIAMGANNVIADIELGLLKEQTLKTEVENIIMQTQELSKTIDDFRDFFKPNKHKEGVLVPDMLLASLSIISKSFENNAIEIENIFDSTTTLSLYSRELEQVFINILNNAKEALQESKKENKKITNRIYETSESVIIEICDNGTGFNNEVLEKMFEPYFSTKSAKNGTGLGLYMSKAIIEKHLRGKLSAKNSLEGAMIIIELPKVLHND